ncbi:RDD family protein [Candidatus Sumerlaeota bacterium]|nr:RDD family protein [Candidatus Sumerlaeota bacterium]
MVHWSTMETLEKPLPTPRPPFAPFIPRASAFVIDLVLIYFVGYTLELAFRAPLLRLGIFLHPLSSVAAFAYFWLGNGPVGRGATLGKSVLNLRVLGPDGRALEFGPSFRRTLLQLPPIVPVTFIFLSEAFDFPLLFSVYGGDFLALAATTFLIAHGYCVVAHPRRQGWHDVWAGSFVTHDPPSPEFLQAAGEDEDPNLISRLATHRLISVVFFLLIGLFTGGRWFLTLFNSEARRQIVFSNSLAEDLEVQGYRLEGIGLRPSDDATVPGAAAPPTDSEDPAGAGEPSAGARGSDSDTDADSTVVFTFVRTGGAVVRSDFEDFDRRGQIELLRKNWPLIYGDLRREDDPLAAPTARFAARFSDRFRFVLFSYRGGNSWQAQGPADPSQGPLTYEWFDKTETPEAEGPPDSVQ